MVVKYVDIEYLRAQNSSAGQLIITGLSNSVVFNSNIAVDASGNIILGSWTASVISPLFGGTGFDFYNTGDIIYSSSSGSNLSKLPIGVNGNILIVNDGLPVWGSINLSSTSAVGSSILGLANGGTNASIQAVNGSILYTTNSSFATLLPSTTSGNILISGANSSPTWGYSYSSENLPNTIVSRDSKGSINVSQLTASADLVVNGNLQVAQLATVNELTSNGKVLGTDAIFTSVQSSRNIIGQHVISNSAVSGNNFVISSNTTEVIDDNELVIDIWPKDDYRTVSYIVQITDNTNLGDFQSGQMLILHNDIEAIKNEFSVLYTNQLLGQFDTYLFDNQVAITFKAVSSTNKTVKILRTGISP